MRILISNDDGFMREGIRTLEAVLIRHGHEVYSVAPHTEQSAKSHSMTVLGSVTIWKHDDHHYSCLLYTSPSPRDIVKSRMPSSA